MPPAASMIAAIEAGGTKFVCGAGRSWQEVRSATKHIVATTTPDRTMASVIDWLRHVNSSNPIAAVGVASFGPLDLDNGRIADSTPKRDWAGFDWVAIVGRNFPLAQMAFDTDTNAAALAEWRWGASRKSDVSAYVTVGTGVGGGIVVGGQPVHGLVHPELGHMRVPRQPSDGFAGVCPFHGDCLEGLASGSAIEARWGQRGETLPGDHPAWQLESEYLALAVVNIAVMVSPQAILLGGGVMQVPGLISAVQRRAAELISSYVQVPDPVVTSPALFPDSGLLGAFAIAQQALAKGH